MKAIAFYIAIFLITILAPFIFGFKFFSGEMVAFYGGMFIVSMIFSPKIEE